MQSNVWKNKLKSQPYKIILPYFLYFDDYETNNALGSHTGLQKLGDVSKSFNLCLPPEFSLFKHQLKLAYLNISENILSPKIGYGRVIVFSNEVLVMMY